MATTVAYTFSHAVAPNALGYAEPKQSPEVIDLTLDAPSVKDEVPPSQPVAPVVGEDEYTCPISMDLMVDPVMADDGHMYDLAYLLQWFSTNTGNTIKSPKTNEMMTKGVIRPWGFHKTYAAWAAATGHPAPVAAGPYGRVVDTVYAARAVIERRVVATVVTRVPAPAPPAQEPVPVRAFEPPASARRVRLNCLDAPDIWLCVPVHLAYLMMEVHGITLQARFRRWTQTQAHAIIKTNFPEFRIPSRGDYKMALQRLIKSCHNGMDLGHLVFVNRITDFTPGLRLTLRLTVEEYLHIRGPVVSVGETVKRLTLQMLRNVARRNNAAHLVTSMSTKARAVLIFAEFFTPLCTPVLIDH